MFSSLRYFWSEAFKSLFRNQFMAIASVLTVTVSMFIPVSYTHLTLPTT